MDEYQRFRRTEWDCRYPVILLLKCSRKTQYVPLRTHQGGVFRRPRCAASTPSP